MVDIPHIVGERNKKPLQLSGTVALVGNSDALAGIGKGTEIDQYDNVFRFNLADLSNEFAPDVGSKVDYCFFSLNISTRKYPHSKREHMRFVQLCRKAKIICYPGNSKNIKKFQKSPLAMTATVGDINTILHRALVLPFKGFSSRNHPRNGIKLLACLIDAGVKPVLYGFDLEDRGINSHYFDDEVQLELPEGGHLPSLEYRLLRDLEDRGLLVLK